MLLAAKPAGGTGATGAPPQTAMTAPVGGPDGNFDVHAWFTTAGARQTKPTNAPPSMTQSAASVQPCAAAATPRSSIVPPPQTASANPPVRGSEPVSWPRPGGVWARTVEAPARRCIASPSKRR